MSGIKVSQLRKPDGREGGRHHLSHFSPEAFFSQLKLIFDEGKLPEPRFCIGIVFVQQSRPAHQESLHLERLAGEFFDDFEIYALGDLQENLCIYFQSESVGCFVKQNGFVVVLGSLLEQADFLIFFL